MKKIIVVFGLSFCFFLPSCYHNNKQVITNKIVAYIDTIPITINQVDNKIQQEIFDELNRIYLIRKVALSDVIEDKILKLEASKRNMSVDELLDSLYDTRINKVTLNKYVIENRYGDGIPVFERSLIKVDINSDSGYNTLIKRFKEYILSIYIDSLKNAYNTKILLDPPVPPSIKIEDLLIHFRENVKSKTTCIIISDFECEMCRKYNPIFDSLYLKYRDKVVFGFTNFGSYPTISAIASECAAKQGKFWEMHDALFSLSSLPDTNKIFSIASKLEMNIVEFKNDFYSEKVKESIENNLKLIINSGVYATPTIMINNRPVFNSSSIEEIEHMLLNAL